MRLELGRRADYGIRATIDLARHFDAGVRRKAREIASDMEIPRTFVAQVLADLVRAGLVESTAGPDGGYRMAVGPDRVNLLTVVRAVDGEPGSKVCVLRGGPCRWDDQCAVHLPWFRAQQAMLDELERVTFADLVEIDTALAEDAGEIPPSPMGESADLRAGGS